MIIKLYFFTNNYKDSLITVPIFLNNVNYNTNNHTKKSKSSLIIKSLEFKIDSKKLSNSLSGGFPDTKNYQAGFLPPPQKKTNN